MFATTQKLQCLFLHMFRVYRVDSYAKGTYPEVNIMCRVLLKEPRERVLGPGVYKTLPSSVHLYVPSLCWHHLRLLSARFSLRILKVHGGSWLLVRCLRETVGMILPWEPQNLFSDPAWIPEWNVVPLSSNLWSLVYKGLAQFLAYTLVCVLSVTVFGVKRNMQHYW